MTSKKESPTKNVEVIEEFTPIKPDFKHRYEDLPQNNIIHAAAQIDTVLHLLYGILEPDTELPPTSLNMIETMHQRHEMKKQQVLDALFIIDSLASDICVLANSFE